jgi:deoxyribodipyrimidine photo-lyase
VAFCLVDDFLGATRRHFGFMLRGLEETSKKLAELNTPFHFLKGWPEKRMPEYLQEIRAELLVTDFDPLKIRKFWISETARQIDIPVHEVDAHNIVPCRHASDKEEFAAYTIRPKINKKLDKFLVNFPKLERYPFNYVADLNHHYKFEYDLSKYADFPAETDFIPGAGAAENILENFITNKLDKYAELRNDPANGFLSDMSPYFHFGQIAPQRVALAVKNSGKNKESIDSYLEEMIIRRELSDNYCFYNENYDNFEGFRDWAKLTLTEHLKDERERIYSIEEFERAITHDDYWNAAQLEMVNTGKMHGYMRMYWAKKILEWTETPQEAQKTAIYLNDKYELDGRDPNGYVGIAWSIGGVHDRGWTERPVFGKIRYMNDKGLKRKFKIDNYRDKYLKRGLF